MTEWKLFDLEVPEQPEYLAGRSWMQLEGQPGFSQRAQLVAGLVRHMGPVSSICDLGCGDGAMLSLLGREISPVPMWGYDLGAEDLAYGQAHGLDLREADITKPAGLEYGELVICTEVVEHLADPYRFLDGIRSRMLVISSPSAETGAWHNPIHAWAWDLRGYANLAYRSGWTVVRQEECDGGVNSFAGVPGPQRFQAIAAVR
jgi:hypothetical protein